MEIIVLIVLFVLIVAAASLVAVSSGRRGRGPIAVLTSKERSFGLLIALLSVIYFVFAVPLAVMFANVGHARKVSGNMKLTKGQEEGREIFAAKCGFCHTLQAAKTVGTIGPNFDQMNLSPEFVLAKVKSGNSNIEGQMPRELVQGKEASDVASFVARTAGTKVRLSGLPNQSPHDHHHHHN